MAPDSAADTASKEEPNGTKVLDAEYLRGAEHDATYFIYDVCKSGTCTMCIRPAVVVWTCMSDLKGGQLCGPCADVRLPQWELELEQHKASAIPCPKP